VNAKGLVVGVAVGFLDSGQSLNFAVPATKVAALLKNGSPKLDLGLFDQIESLRDQRKAETYSADADSDWQKTNNQIKSLLKKGFEDAGNDDAILLRVAKLAYDDWDADVAISSAEKLVALKPSPETHTVFAQALTLKYEFARDDSEKQKAMSQAEKEARLAVNTTRVPSAESYSVLANVLEDRGSYGEAKTDFGLALDAAKKIIDSDLRLSSTRGLIRCADAQKEFDEADRLLEGLKRDGESTAWDWSSHAHQLSSNSLYQRAGDAYRAAAELNGPYANWCSAATMYAMISQQDSTLFSARQCIEKGTGIKDSELELADAHRQIADVLNARGVYIEALNHAKEATALQPDNAFAYDDMAQALIGLRRFNEAVTAAGQAVRLSDGKFAWMHFNLGSAYFSLENWDFALQSYEKAAELSPEEPAAAYNTALSHQRLLHFSDAVHWYREYLRRKPNADDKAEVLERIRLLQQ